MALFGSLASNACPWMPGITGISARSGNRVEQSGSADVRRTQSGISIRIRSRMACTAGSCAAFWGVILVVLIGTRRVLYDSIFTSMKWSILAMVALVRASRANWFTLLQSAHHRRRQNRDDHDHNQQLDHGHAASGTKGLGIGD